MHLTASTTVHPTYTTPPTEQKFLLFVDPVGKSIVASAGAIARRVPVTSRDSAAFVAQERLDILIVPSACGDGAQYSTFSFTASDAGITGRAIGTAQVIEGDVSFSYEAELEFSGVPATWGPTVQVGTSVDPLHAATFEVSQPIPEQATARVVLATEAVDLAPGIAGNTVTSFAVPMNVALRYDAAYQLEITPWQDLAGHPGVPPAPVVTISAPEQIAEDGFEGDAHMVGGALVVDSTVLPPISGLRSAVVQAPGFGTIGNDTPVLRARLNVQAGDNVVRVAVRPYAAIQATAIQRGRLRVAAPGGALVEATELGWEMINTRITTGGRTLYFGEVRTVEVPLPRGTTSEVVFELGVGPSDNRCGLRPPAANYLVDDLRVE